MTGAVQPHPAPRRAAAAATLGFALALIAGGDDDAPSGDEILGRLDANLSSSNRVFTSSMIVHGRRVVRAVSSRTWAEGDGRAFTEYLSPAREKGIKMLKLENRLWMYSPATDRTIQISGHMLRQSVMGSDLSYEDMMEDPRLSRRYRADVVGEDSRDGRPCWVVRLTAREPDLAYHARKLWVDKERNVPLREELFARSGKLLKRTELKDVQSIGGRWFPTRVRFKDMLKTGAGTEFVIETISFDQDLPAYIFTKAALRR